MATIRVDQLSSKTPADDDVVLIANAGGFYTWTGAALQSYAGSGGGAYSVATLTASSETSMRIRYSGTAPTLTKTAAGEYRLTVPTGTLVKSFHWSESGATFTGSNSIKLTVRDTDGESLYGNYTVIQATGGTEIGQLAGVVIKQTTPTSGDVLVEFPNMASVSGGFIIVGTIL